MEHPTVAQPVGRHPGSRAVRSLAGLARGRRQHENHRASVTIESYVLQIHEQLFAQEVAHHCRRLELGDGCRHGCSVGKLPAFAHVVGLKMIEIRAILTVDVRADRRSHAAAVAVASVDRGRGKKGESTSSTITTHQAVENGCWPVVSSIWQCRTVTPRSDPRRRWVAIQQPTRPAGGRFADPAKSTPFSAFACSHVEKPWKYGASDEPRTDCFLRQRRAPIIHYPICGICRSPLRAPAGIVSRGERRFGGWPRLFGGPINRIGWYT